MNFGLGEDIGRDRFYHGSDPQRNMRRKLPQPPLSFGLQNLPKPRDDAFRDDAFIDVVWPESTNRLKRDTCDLPPTEPLDQRASSGQYDHPR